RRIACSHHTTVAPRLLPRLPRLERTPPPPRRYARCGLVDALRETRLGKAARWHARGGRHAAWLGDVQECLWITTAGLTTPPNTRTSPRISPRHKQNALCDWTFIQPQRAS